MKIHFIANAHIDPVWLWDRTEGMGAAISTFRSAVNMLKRFPDLIFCHNEAVLYKYVERCDNALFQEITKLVKEGRWKIIGGWYLQPDCNMPSGESFIRQIKFGREYFRIKFGIDRFDTAINFDSFGHTVGLVQILAKAGYKNYLVTRPRHLDDVGEYIHGAHIKWHGAAGTSVDVYKAPSYCTPLGNVLEQYPYAMRKQAHQPVACYLWGVGDHGGGPSAVDTGTLNEFFRSGDMSYEGSGKETEIRGFHSHPDAFFEDFRKEGGKDDIVTDRSLRSFSVGCYTSMCRIKQKHFRLENDLLFAEKICLAAFENDPAEYYPGANLRSAWEDLLFTEFHDSLPGSSIQKVEDDMLDMLGRGITTAKDETAQAFFALCRGQKPAPDGDTPVLVFNPNPYPVTTDVETEYMLEKTAGETAGEGESTFAVVRGEDGRVLPSQNERASSSLPTDWAKKLVFRATLAPMTVTRFNVGRRIDKIKAKFFEDVPAKEPDGDISVSAKGQTVTVSKETGLLSVSRGGKTLIENGARILVIEDDSDPWGMNVSSFRNVKGGFSLCTPESAASLSALPEETLPPVRVIEDGDIRTVVEAIFGYRSSYAAVRYYLSKYDATVKINIRLFMCEKDTMLKLAFPTHIPGELYGDAAFMREKLVSDGRELVCRGCSIVSDKTCAAAFYTFGTHGFSCERGENGELELRISLLRTPGYAAHPIGDRRVLPADRLSPRQDQGERIFDLALETGDAAAILEEAGAVSQMLSQPPFALCFAPSPEGKRPKAPVEIENRRIVLSAAYRKGGRAVYRFFNPTSEKKETKIKFPSLNIHSAFSLEPFEFRTFAVTRDSIDEIAM